MIKLRISSKHPDKKKIGIAAQIIKAGGIAIFPTETVYGLGASPYNKKAVNKIFKLKGRSLKKPLAVIISDPIQVRPLVKHISRQARTLMKRYWPGPLTLIFNKSSKIPSYVTAGGRTLGIRMPDDPITRELIKAAGMPIVATSANRSGAKDPFTAKEAIRQLKQADVVIDGGRTRLRKPSTVIDVTGKRMKILRKGSLSKL